MEQLKSRISESISNKKDEDIVKSMLYIFSTDNADY